LQLRSRPGLPRAVRGKSMRVRRIRRRTRPGRGARRGEDAVRATTHADPRKAVCLSAAQDPDSSMPPSHIFHPHSCTTLHRRKAAPPLGLADAGHVGTSSTTRSACVNETLSCSAHSHSTADLPGNRHQDRLSLKLLHLFLTACGRNVAQSVSAPPAHLREQPAPS
jgi:hypothetical protein